MNHDIIKNVILDQHNVIKNVKICDRDYILEDNICYVLVGLRRAGKSTLLYKKVLDYIKTDISWEQIIYINFEDERLSEFNINDFQDILLVKEELTSKKGYYFFDEIQNVDGWEKFARRLADQNEAVCITGSNSKMLSSEMSAKLGGRYITKYIMPYNLSEFLRANNITINESTQNKGIVNYMINEYMQYGGLPAVNSFNDKREYINSVYSKLLLNDILLHNNIRNEQSMKILIKKIAETVKDEISYSKLYNIMKTIGFTISKDSIIDYVGYMIDANLIFDVRNYYSAFVDKESTPKYYFTDNGILSLFLVDKKGKLLENMVSTHIKRMGYDFYYLKSSKTGIDIDFYIPDLSLLIQVAYSLNDYEAKAREINEFIKYNKYNADNSKYVIITLNEEEVINENGVQIEVIPFKKFFVK